MTGADLELAPDRVPEPGRATALSDLVVRVTADNPGMMTGPGTNSYLVGARQLVVVDPGPDEPAHLDALAEIGAGRIRWIVVTHTHLDHAPGAAGLAARTGAEVIGFDARDDFEPGRAVGEGFELEGADFTLRALHTPGHASNHLCWLLVGDGTVFSGDHVMQGSTVVIRPPDGDMAHYLASLRRLIALDPGVQRIAPGHGALLDDPVATMARIIVHRLERQRAVADALARARRATVDALVPGVYADVDEDRYHVARQSLWAHLRKLAQDGLAVSDDPDDPAADWAWVA